MPQLAEQPNEPCATPTLIGSTRRFLFCLGLLFGGHVILRALLSPTANLDEAEQLMLTQDWALGYGPQPPLYTWLQASVFKLLGVSILSLALLKNAFLFCTYALAYLSAKLITGRHGAGVLASLSLLFIPQIAWESQRDLTHSVLAATTSMGTLYCFLKCHRSARLRWYLFFGLSVACGALAKYNFLLWAAGLLAGAVSVAAFRKHVLNWKMAVAFAFAATIVTPHAVWAFRNQDLVTQTSSKLHIVTGGSGTAEAKPGLLMKATKPLMARAEGITKLVSAIVRFIGPLVGILALLFWTRRRCLTSAWVVHEETRLLARAIVCICLILLLFVLFFGVTGFKDRWFQPILVGSTVLFAISVYRCCREATLRIVCWMAVGVALIVGVFIPGKVLFASKTGRLERLNFPISDIAGKLEKVMEPGAVIAADTPFLAGNLRLALPGRRVISPLWGYQDEKTVWVTWDAGKRAKAPRELFRLGGENFAKVGEPMLLRAQLRNEPSETYALGAVKAEKRKRSASAKPLE